MKQLILSEATEILAATATESTVLDDDWFGTFQVILTTAGTDAVKLQVMRPGSNPAVWTTARYNGNEITLTTAGDTLDIVLTEHYHYRFTTTTAGAVVHIDSH